MDPLDVLKTMVEIESLSGQEQQVAKFIVEQMQQLGFSESYVDEAGNAVGICSPKSSNYRDIVLLGHMDTVPGKIPVRVEDDILYGRGSVDAKGPLATFVMAAAQAQPADDLRIVVIGAVEEEAATSKGARHIADLYKPEACIIGEPSGWDAVTLGYKGRMLVDYRCEQDMGHTAGPNTAVGEIACEWWNKIRQYADEFNKEQPKLFHQLLPSLRNVNTSSDGLTDVASAVVGFRLPPKFDLQALEAKVQEWAQDAKVKCYAKEMAYQTGRSNPLVRAFLKSMSEEQTRLRFKMKTGTSDMNVVGPRWQCPIVAYGPGDSKLDHTPNEHVSIAEYQRAIEVLTRVLNSY